MDTIASAWAGNAGLILGCLPGSSGTCNLLSNDSPTGFINAMPSARNETIGCLGEGIFLHDTQARHSVAGNLVLALGFGSTGRHTLESGSVTVAGNEVIGASTSI